MEKKFVKKPVVITAYQTDVEKEIETLEGTMKASPGDWIITGVNGEKYPCKPDIFEQTYSSVENDESEQLLSPGMRFYCQYTNENYIVVENENGLAFFCPERMDVFRFMTFAAKVGHITKIYETEYMGKVEFTKEYDAVYHVRVVDDEEQEEPSGDHLDFFEGLDE